MGTVTGTPEAAEVVAKDAKIMQALVKADFELLGTKLVAEYYKGKDSEYFLLMPTDEKEARGITIEKMLNDISALLGIAVGDINTEELISSIDSLGLKVSEIKVVLKMAYFYMILDENNKQNTEYAFQLEIDTSAVLPETFKMFNIDRVGVAVWNTDRSKIIEKMNLYKAQDLLG